MQNRLRTAKVGRPAIRVLAEKREDWRGSRDFSEVRDAEGEKSCGPYELQRSQGSKRG